jgi:hypothetical protein
MGGAYDTSEIVTIQFWILDFGFWIEEMRSFVLKGACKDAKIFLYPLHPLIPVKLPVNIRPGRSLSRF